MFTASFACVVLALPLPADKPDAIKEPPPSRYLYFIKIDEKSLPKGVTVRAVGEEPNVRHFIKNAEATPLIINEIHDQFGKLVSGTKLENGKVYGWFPNGVPMAGKEHLKGWQAPFGDVTETHFALPKEPNTIIAGRKPGLGKELPKPEDTVISVNYDGKPHGIKVTIHYRLNEAYDKKK